MDTQEWTGRFAKNQLNRTEPDWKAPMNLPEDARKPLVQSLAEFQLGDGGGPAYLIANDKMRFLSEGSMKKLVDLWFKEEEEHSRLLGKALDRFGGTPITGHWSFSLFCGMRKYLGVRFELTALLLTEIVSNVYYKMLHCHCEDIALKQMCRLIIRDETGHIAFHHARLVSDGNEINPVKGLIFRLLGVAAGSVLWINHRKAVVALGGKTGGFYRTIWKDMNRFVKKLNLCIADNHKAASKNLSPPQATEFLTNSPLAGGIGRSSG